MPPSHIDPPTRPRLGEQLSFLAVINFVLRNLGVMLIIGVIASVIFSVQVARAPRTFSSTSIFSTGEGNGGGLIAMLGGGSKLSDLGAQYYVDLMTAPNVLEPLAKMEYDFPKEGRESAVKYYGGKLPPDRALEAAMSAISSKIHPRITATSGWIVLRTAAETPDLAVQFNYAVLAQLDTFNSQKRRRQAAEDERFAEERLADLGVQVRRA